MQKHRRRNTPAFTVLAYFTLAAGVFLFCMFLGGGIGSLLHEPHSGWLIGMGVGFIGLALSKYFLK